MEVLAEKIAELLGITVDAAVEVYPYIRDQYVMYGVLDSIKAVFVILVVVSTILSIFSVGFLFFDGVDFENPDDEEKIFIKAAKWSVIVFIFSLIMTMSVSIAQAVLSPDIMLIRELLG